MSALFTPNSIITAHLNADFDALAAMLAAQKIYPEAMLVTPPYLDKRRMEDFLKSSGFMPPAGAATPAPGLFYQPKDCDFSQVRLLIVVDTRQRERLTHIASVLDNPGLKIHVYDHHPDSADDLPAHCSTVREWGASTTVLTSLLQEKDLSLSASEATLLGLGLYEDTGAFTSPQTTRDDFLAAAWLLGQGMDLNRITDILDNSLTSRQVNILNRMIENAATHEIHGVNMVFTELVLDCFVEDFALLVHQLMNMEKAQAVLALGQMGDRVHIAARSRLPDKLDVGKICAAFGGGGHPYAAAASVKDKTIAELKTELFALFFSAINEEINVGAKMTAPAKVVEESDSLAEAEAVMLRYGLKAAPVVVNGGMRCLGLLEHQTAARAVSHKLGNRPVSDYMNGGAKTLLPSSSLYPAMDIILNQRQRMVPVVDAAENVLGVLTRTDIMRLLLDESIRISDGVPLSATQKERNVAALMKEKLPEAYYDLLTLIGKLADKLGTSVYVVGGFVRDLLLDRVNLDIDLTVEGDGMEFANALAEQLGGRMRSHPKFQTSLVIYQDGQSVEQRIDVATARLEYYEYPGALPTVELSSIKMDLSRRDFSINALAIRLNPAHFGLLVDPFGAQRDMKDKNVRVLHSLSFVEDPTRVMRAVRFEKRFGFKMDQQSEKLVKNCLQLGLVRNLSGTRLFNELKHIFNEKTPLPCLERLDNFGALADMHALLKLTPAKAELLAGVEEVLSWYNLLFLQEKPEVWAVYLLGLCAGLKYKEMAEVLKRFLFTQRAGSDFQRLRESTRKGAGLIGEWKNSAARDPRGLYAILLPLSLEGILYIMAQAEFRDIKKEISHFLSRLRHLRLEINGRDIMELGAPRGPGVGLVLRRVMEARLEDKAATREEQLALAKQYLIEAGIISPEQQGIDEVFSGRT